MTTLAIRMQSTISGLHNAQEILVVATKSFDDLQKARLEARSNEPLTIVAPVTIYNVSHTLITLAVRAARLL